VYEDAPEAVARLKKAGFQIIVVTNQPDVSTGKLPLETLDQMHAHLAQVLDLDGIEVSTATRANPDRRRKPEPGMLIDAAEERGIDLAASFMVGDRASDVEAGRRAGCRTVFVDLGYTAEPKPTSADTTVTGVMAAADWILKRG